jgi:hypothetical protein
MRVDGNRVHARFKKPGAITLASSKTKISRDEELTHHFHVNNGMNPILVASSSLVGGDLDYLARRKLNTMRR